MVQYRSDGESGAGAVACCFVGNPIKPAYTTHTYISSAKVIRLKLFFMYEWYASEITCSGEGWGRRLEPWGHSLSTSFPVHASGTSKDGVRVGLLLLVIPPLSPPVLSSAPVSLPPRPPHVIPSAQRIPSTTVPPFHPFPPCATQVQSQLGHRPDMLASSVKCAYASSDKRLSFTSSSDFNRPSSSFTLD